MTVTDVSYSRRTNVEIVADVVATLLHHGLIERTDLTLARVRDLLGVSLDDLRHAAERRKAARFAPITPAIHVTPQPVVQAAASKPAAAHRRPQRIVAEQLEYQCTGGVTAGPHWAEKAAFDPRSEAPHRRKSKCRLHQLETQRARRITNDAAKALIAADLDLLYDGHGREVGVECVRGGSKVGCGCDLPSPSRGREFGTAADIDAEVL